MKRLLCLTLLMTCVLLAARTVKITDFNPQKEDATTAIQAALDSKADVVIFDNPGYPYLVNPLFLRSNQELVFQDGVVVRAIKGSFLGTNDSLFKGEMVENIVMRGEGTAILEMNKRDYWDKKRYRPAEWRHTIALLTTTNVRIADLTIRSSGGDGIYVSDSNSAKRKYCKDTLIENCMLDDHHRQGISVIGAENLLIRNCTLQNTIGTAPQCGIDFEPNHQEGEVFINCVVENCLFTKNAMAGILVHCPGQRIPIDLTFRDCVVKDNVAGIVCTVDHNEESPSKGLVKFQNITIENNDLPVRLRNTRPEGPAILMRNCLIKGTEKTGAIINFATIFQQDFGNVVFDDVRVVKSPKQRLAALNSPRGAGVTLPPGKITVEDSETHKETIIDSSTINEEFPRNEEMVNFNVASFKGKGLKPATQNVKADNTFALRTNYIPYYQFVEAGKDIDIDFTTLFLAETDRMVNCKVIDTANETQISQFSFKTPTYTWHYSPTVTTVLRLEFDTHQKSIIIKSRNPGFGFGAFPAFKAFRSTGTLYFQVPADLKEVKVLVQGDDGEPVQIEVIDAQGKVRATSEYDVTGQLLTIKREVTAAPEMWRVRIVKMVEDYTIRLGAPIQPILYSSPDNLLK
ncbi:MAG: right-handed parallel beta-helix repeat-containing protein [Victivallales bacterium]|nr:right-handed parallel beta-helix repeat-containing protein [Victivallales bacterium]